MPPEPADSGSGGAASALSRVLFDESVPPDLAAHVVGFNVTTVQELGWAGMKNGELLRAARRSASKYW